MFKTTYKPPTINTYIWQGVKYWRVNWWDAKGASTTDCLSQKGV